MARWRVIYGFIPFPKALAQNELQRAGIEDLKSDGPQNA